MKIGAGTGFYIGKYMIALIIAVICFVSLIHGYAVGLEKLDMQIISAEEFYNKLLPYSYIKSVLSSADDKIDRACEDIMTLLEKNGVHESQYCASIFTKEAIKITGYNPARSELLLNCAKKMAPGYQKAYFSQAILSAYNFDPAGVLENSAAIIYFNFLSPSAVFGSMNLALIFLISVIVIQFIFLSAQYIKYRRLIMHASHEFGVSTAVVPITPYLEPKERTASSLLGKNVIICLVFVIFYCYFSTGFGRYLKLAVETNEFLKNPHEFYAINAVAEGYRAPLSDLDRVLAPAFKDEKHSVDFYYYFSYISKIVCRDTPGALAYSKKISHGSFLAAKTVPASTVFFLDDADLYSAFFSPIRSNPLFMIAVLLNVLLIIVFMGIIRKAAAFHGGAKADLCACSTISCPECRVQVGLCNSCLMPIKHQNEGRNIKKLFYPHDKKVVYYASLILPGFSFFYFSEFALAFFYSALIINISIFNAAASAGFFAEGSVRMPLLALIYIIYLVENSFFIKGRQ
ncbi:MAG: hypothetical protein A2008_00845 [Candidatus Wallbacteria bacterium GWC2_49_35]|uniref:Uncharacterized protein n=1 Tax=Candidatus Wallbacteria bacterium GWC2_49_35 TaxID=1817813 RepID=A0A1F7WQL8_9BACT|nr:MAG: hypothetical protein A2008_00845 [Candidatus Wallbacteria bacterium GWC2_49_35]HBC75215.1 hypothetical protein [Candidatus Wallbacteria bacterium]